MPKKSGTRSVDVKAGDYSIKQMATTLGISQTAVQGKIATKVLPGKQIGTHWIINIPADTVIEVRNY